MEDRVLKAADMQKSTDGEDSSDDNNASSSSMMVAIAEKPETCRNYGT